MSSFNIAETGFFRFSPADEESDTMDLSIYALTNKRNPLG